MWMIAAMLPVALRTTMLCGTCHCAMLKCCAAVVMAAVAAVAVAVAVAVHLIL